MAPCVPPLLATTLLAMAMASLSGNGSSVLAFQHRAPSSRRSVPVRPLRGCCDDPDCSGNKEAAEEEEKPAIKRRFAPLEMPKPADEASTSSPTTSAADPLSGVIAGFDAPPAVRRPGTVAFAPKNDAGGGDVAASASLFALSSN